MSQYKLKTPKAVEEAVVGTYQKIEDAVVGAYRKIEDGAVSGYKKVEETFVDAFLEKVEDTTSSETPDNGGTPDLDRVD